MSKKNEDKSQKQEIERAHDDDNRTAGVVVVEESEGVGGVSPSSTATPDANEDRTTPVPSASTTSGECYHLHYLIFHGEYQQLARMVERPPTNWQLATELARQDKHGNSPLHLAVMLGRKDIVHLLLALGAPIQLKNNDGWSPLEEAISYGDRQTIAELLRKLKQQSRQHMEARCANLARPLQQMRDFYMELKLDLASWVPLVSRKLPSDICRIHKSGASLRLDTTLFDFNHMRWKRGDLSFIFRGDRASHEPLTALDNELQSYRNVRYENFNVEDEADVLMSSDILTGQLSTKSVRFARAQSGWIFRENRTELVSGQYQCDLYSIQGLLLNKRKRREHMSHADLQKNRATTTTDSGSSASTKRPRRSSLQPPPPPSVTWSQYINAPTDKCPHLGRPPVHKQSSKAVRATVAMSKDFPLSVEMLLNVLEAVAPIRHVDKLREFATLKLPAGFPVMVEIPLLHTVTAKITCQKFEFRDNIPAALFEVPAHYVKASRRRPRRLCPQQQETVDLNRNATAASLDHVNNEQEKDFPDQK